MKLLLFKNDEFISELRLTSGQTYKVGRLENCDMVLEKLPGISREHFEISEESPGQWRVNVLSEIKLVEINGEERKDFVLAGEGSFELDPFVFHYEGEQSSKIPLNAMVENSLEALPSEQDDIEDFKNDDDSKSFSGSFGGNDEKTAIHSFSGLPYIKIIGQDGKKSEYFRLEGNLWVVGGHEGASVYIREPGAVPSHFEISKTEKGFFIIDLGSPQGTELNGQKLVAKKHSRLLSGDIITVGNTSLQFELRDKAFKRKISNIPLNMYKNPLVFFDQDVAMVSIDEEDNAEGRVEEIKERSNKNQKNKLRPLLIAAAVIGLAFVAKNEFGSKESNKKAAKANDPFSELSPRDQKMVLQSYKLANQMYLSQNYELALAQLDNLHQIIPVYKKSREWEEFCINARDVQREQAAIAQQRREADELEEKVNSFISQCEGQFRNSEDIDGVKACLIPATDLDPNNPRISNLISDVTARHEEKKIRLKLAQENADKIRRGKELFERAKVLHKKQKWLDAIEAYENHIHSGLPDPKGLVKKSKRSLSSIEKQINSRKSAFMGQAQNNYTSSNLKEAIRLARKAQKVDPYDPKISAFLFQVEKELTNRMKAIFMDSKIEEQFSNLEASRIKWEEIVKKDIEDGEYYQKARRKLKQYGYEY